MPCPRSFYSAYRSGLVAFVFVIGFLIPLIFCLYRLWVTRTRRVHTHSHLERRLRELLAAPYLSGGPLYPGLSPLERSLLAPHAYAAKPAAVPAAAAAAAAAALEGAPQHDLRPAAPLDGQQGCVICLEEFTAAGGEVLTLPCAHIFHALCAERWFEQSTCCPLCKFDLRPVLAEMLQALGEGEGGVLGYSSTAGTVAAPPASHRSALV